MKDFNQTLFPPAIMIAFIVFFFIFSGNLSIDIMYL